MTENEQDLIIGPGGFPGEFKFMVPTAGNDFISLLSGMYSVDTKNIDWSTLPKSFPSIAVEDGDKTWLPSVVTNPGVGSIYPEIGASGDWYWVVLPVKTDAAGKIVPDTANVKVLKKSQYMDALSAIDMLKGIINPE